TDAMSGSPTFSLTAPAGLPNAVSFLDVALQPWSSIVYSVGTSTAGPRIATTGTPVVYRDLDNNGPDAGDIIEVRFDAEVTVGNAPAAICFRLPVIGNSFGQNAFIRGSQNLALTQQERARTVEIVLGANTKLLPAGTYSGANGFGNPSGLDILATIPTWAVADVFGNSAQTNLSGPSDIGSDDTTAPNMVAAVYRDENSNGLVDVGDAIIIVFDESLVRNGVNRTHFQAEIQSSTVFSFGNATLGLGPNKTVNGMVIQNNSLRLTLGTGTTLQAQEGVDLVITSGNPLADVSGNVVQVGQRIALDLNLPETPMPVLARIHDVNQNGMADGGDRIWVKFNRSVNIAASDPSQAFSLINPTASFGSGAFMAISTVDTPLLATGMTARGIGEQDPQIVTITLGSSPVLPDIAGTAPSFVFNYATGQVPSLIAGPNTPVGIAMRPTSGGVFSATALASAFPNAAANGSATRFEDVTLQLGLFDGAPAVDSVLVPFELPGQAAAFLPTAAHVQRLASAMNVSFKDKGRTYRAYANSLNQLIVVTNSNFAITSIGFSGDDVSSTSGVIYNMGMTNQVTSNGNPMVLARGSVDLTGTLSSGGGGGGPAPNLSFAEFLGTTISV
ncbi:MAG: hypothetical protein KDB07_12405, partial [Planctomycetes bacterium]|nr:hypothetical protein [Planctomycetota bacterium]